MTEKQSPWSGDRPARPAGTVEAGNAVEAWADAKIEKFKEGWKEAAEAQGRLGFFRRKVKRIISLVWLAGFVALVVLALAAVGFVLWAALSLLLVLGGLILATVLAVGLCAIVLLVVWVLFFA